MVASSVVARIGVSTRSAWLIARETRREAMPSRSTITIWPFLSWALIVRTISASVTSDRTVMCGGSAPRLAHSESERFGSQSSSVTSAPARASSVPRITAQVDFPAPPFDDAMATTGMHSPYQVECFIRYFWLPDFLTHLIDGFTR